MHISFKFILLASFFFYINQSFADINHGNGYVYTNAGKRLKLDDDEAIIKKFIKAFDGKLDSYVDRKEAPKLSKSDGSPSAYILRYPGKARGERPARRRTTIGIYNQEVPQAVKNLAMAEFGAKSEDFKEFPMGIKFIVSERKGKKFSASLNVYRKDKKREGRPETIAMGEGTMLEMPKGVYKFKSKTIAKVKGTQYTLYGRGEAKSMANEIGKNLKDAGFETEIKSDKEEVSMSEFIIRFNKGEVDGSVGLTQTSSKEPSVNLLMLVKSSKCQTKMKMGNASVFAPGMMSWKCK